MRRSTCKKRPTVRKSILTSGLAIFAIRTIDENGVERFPTRSGQHPSTINGIAADTLRIARDKQLDPVELKVTLCDLWRLVCHPCTFPVEFVADIVKAEKLSSIDCECA